MSELQNLFLDFVAAARKHGVDSSEATAVFNTMNDAISITWHRAYDAGVMAERRRIQSAIEQLRMGA